MESIFCLKHESLRIRLSKDHYRRSVRELYFIENESLVDETNRPSLTASSDLKYLNSIGEPTSLATTVPHGDFSRVIILFRLKPSKTKAITSNLFDYGT